MKVLTFFAAAIVAVATTAQATPVTWSVDQPERY